MTPKMGFERATGQEQARLGELLWDVHAAGLKIVEFTTNRDFKEFAGNVLLRTVVAKMLSLIADGLDQLQAQFPSEFAKISNANRLIETGIQAETLSADKLWQVVEELIPELVAEARAILEDWHQA